jgi:hypothetical protein
MPQIAPFKKMFSRPEIRCENPCRLPKDCRCDREFPPSGGRARDAREDFQKRRFARAVSADNAQASPSLTSKLTSRNAHSSFF